MASDPIALFLEQLEGARASEPFDATACALATADASGVPSLRYVLLKDADARGFTFYTNFGSRKAQQLATNPRAALCFYWPSRSEQVRIEGPVERVSAEEADAYFATRTRGSQLGAWASQQSSPLPSRAVFEEALARVEAEHNGQAVPRPSFWGGYRVVPERIEFWYAREHRLHERVLYLPEGGGWSASGLYP